MMIAVVKKYVKHMNTLKRAKNELENYMPLASGVLLPPR